MAQSYLIEKSGALAQVNPQRRRVLVTGAGGNIGSYFAQHSGDRYELVLLERNAQKMRDQGLDQYGELVECDISDLVALKNVCEGVDTVLHLAGDPSPNATWESLRDTNISGTYNVMVAAKAAGCRRVIFASSIHAISGYPADVQVKTTDPVNPGDLYGVSKAFGEALGRYMAAQEGLSVIALRIGAFQPLSSAQKSEEVSLMDAFVSQRDLNQLIERSIDVENVLFAIFHGLSDNRFKRMDISDARELVGYAPEDSFTALNPSLSHLNLDEKVMAHSQSDGQKSGIREELETLAESA